LRALVAFFNDGIEMNFGPKGQSSNVERPGWKASFSNQKMYNLNLLRGCSHITKYLNSELQKAIFSLAAVETYESIKYY
jgi:hypothetical protein